MDLSLLEKELLDISNIITERKVNQNNMMNEKDRLEKKLGELTIEEYKKASIVLQRLSESQRKAVCSSLSELATAAIQYGIDPSRSIEIEMAGTPSSPKAYVWVTKDSRPDHKEDMLIDNGGGIRNITSTSLRFSLIDNQEEFLDGPIILDEPFRFLSAEYVPTMLEFIEKIRRDSGRQIIIVTHNDFFASSADVNVRISTDSEDKSVIEITRKDDK